MKLFKDLTLGYRSYWNSISFIATHKLWLYFIAPVFIFGAVFYFGYVMQFKARQALADVDSHNFLYMMWDYFVYAFFWVLEKISLNATRYVMLIFLSPILAMISERVENILTGNKYKFNFSQLMKDVRRAVRIAIRNFAYEITIVLILRMLLSIIAWVLAIPDSVSVPVGTAISLIVGFYFYGFGFMDYIMERCRMSMEESVKFVRKHRGVAIALGSIFVLFFHFTLQYFFDPEDPNWTILIIGSILASAIPIFASVAATLAMHELVDLNSNTHAIKEEVEIQEESDVLEAPEDET